MTKANPLIYRCFDDQDIRDRILSKCTDNETKSHIEELYELIKYQCSVINEQRIIIVADKHKKAWSHYDKDISMYDYESRKNLTEEELNARKC